jgi:hypothetical protein
LPDQQEKGEEKEQIKGKEIEGNQNEINAKTTAVGTIRTITTQRR